MTSIRTYSGTIYLCKSCGQPSFDNPGVAMEHFTEQWDGIFCPMFPLAGERLEVAWDPASLDDLKDSYPDTYPHLTGSAAAAAGR